MSPRGPSNEETNKLRILMRGVKDEMFAGHFPHPPKTVAEFVTEGSTIEKALKMGAKHYDRNIVSTANASCVDSMRIPTDRLRETIREILREDLRKLLPKRHNHKSTPLQTSLKQKCSKCWELQRRQ